MIIKVETSDKLLVSASNLYLTTLQPIINQKDASAISEAIKNSLPTPDKLDAVRKELSNGGTYTFTFTDGETGWVQKINETGTLEEKATTNITTASYKVNGVSVSLPYNITRGDELTINIIKTNTEDDATVTLQAQEFSEVNIAKTITGDYDIHDGYEIDINPMMGITCNEVSAAWTIETNINTAELFGEPSPGTPAFSTDDIGREVILELPGGNQTVKITGFIAANNVTIDQLPNETAQGVNFKYKRVLSVANQGTIGGSAAQNTENIQPYLVKNTINGYDALQFTQGPYLVMDKMHSQDFTLFAVCKSFDERTTGTVINSLCGDWYFSRGFWIFLEYGSPVESAGISFYVALHGIETSSSIHYNTFSFRDKFHLVCIRVSDGILNLRFDKTNVLVNINPLSENKNHARTNYLTLGTSGLGGGTGHAGRMILSRFLYYNGYKNDDEVSIIEDKLIQQYDLEI